MLNMYTIIRWISKKIFEIRDFFPNLLQLRPKKHFDFNEEILNLLQLIELIKNSGKVINIKCLIFYI